jgi:hypothetical protein
MVGQDADARGPWDNNSLMARGALATRSQINDPGSTNHPNAWAIGLGVSGQDWASRGLTVPGQPGAAVLAPAAA